MEYQIAQVNIAVPLAPLASEQMYGFTSRLSEVNRLAEAADGFVWRLVDDATPSDDELLVNLAVWRSIEALLAFSYSGAHLEMFRQREQWFQKLDKANYALWWVPVGHIPSLAEAHERLEHLRANGPTEVAFSFAKRFPAPLTDTATI